MSGYRPVERGSRSAIEQRVHTNRWNQVRLQRRNVLVPRLASYCPKRGIQATIVDSDIKLELSRR